MKPDAEHLLKLAEAQHRAYKRATRRLQHRRRLEQVKEVEPWAWLEAVERDDRTDPVEVTCDLITSEGVPA